MPFLSCFISVVKEKSGELAASLPPDHPILVSACYKSQEGYRFASVALRPFHVILVILNYLSKGHGWIDCIHHRYTSFFILQNNHKVVNGFYWFFVDIGYEKDAFLLLPLAKN